EAPVAKTVHTADPAGIGCDRPAWRVPWAEPRVPDRPAGAAIHEARRDARGRAQSPGVDGEGAGGHPRLLRGDPDEGRLGADPGASDRDHVLDRLPALPDAPGPG